MKYIYSVCLCCCFFSSFVLAAQHELPAFDLYGQIIDTHHTDQATTIDFAVNTKQRDAYPYADTIVIGCYDATHNDHRKKLVWKTTVTIHWISLQSAVYASVTIPKWTKDYQVMCHIDDTNIVPERNESNFIAWVTVRAKAWWTIVPPQEPVYKHPQPPVVPSPTPVCTIKKHEACSDVIHEPRWGAYMSSLWLTIPADLKREISEYRIQWFNWSRSKWYTPGVDDIDRKTNCPGDVMYAKNQAKIISPTNCARRVWSYFDDHVHQIRSCFTSEEKVCTLPPVKHTPPVIIPLPPKECIWDYCNLIPLPIVSPAPEKECIWRYCGRRLPPVTKRPPVASPIIHPIPTPPKYSPPLPDDWFSDCLGADCPWRWNNEANNDNQRRIVDPQSINTEFDWLSWL